MNRKKSEFERYGLVSPTRPMTWNSERFGGKVTGMKTTFAATVLILAMALSALCQTTETTRVKVPDSATAASLAEKALAKVYGKKVIESERPFNASLSDGVWHVTGTLYCKDEKGNVVKDACVGGVAMADIRQSDGRVLRTGHTK